LIPEKDDTISFAAVTPSWLTSLSFDQCPIAKDKLNFYLNNSIRLSAERHDTTVTRVERISFVLNVPIPPPNKFKESSRKRY